MFALINIGHMKGVEYSLLSPDGKLEVRVVRTDKGTFEYKFSMGNKLVIDSSPIGYYMTNGNKIPGNDWIIANHSKRMSKSVQNLEPKGFICFYLAGRQRGCHRGNQQAAAQNHQLSRLPRRFLSCLSGRYLYRRGLCRGIQQGAWRRAQRYCGF